MIQVFFAKDSFQTTAKLGREHYSVRCDTNIESKAELEKQD